MESFDTLADEVGALESRVADAIFDTVRAQLRAEGADEAKELERRLSKVRRSLQKAETLLARRERRLAPLVDLVDQQSQVHVVAPVEGERDRRVVVAHVAEPRRKARHRVGQRGQLLLARSAVAP